MWILTCDNSLVNTRHIEEIRIDHGDKKKAPRLVGGSKGGATNGGVSITLATGTDNELAELMNHIAASLAQSKTFLNLYDR